MTCAIKDCDRKVYGHGWCEKHYDRWRRNGDPLLVKIKMTPKQEIADFVKRALTIDADGSCLLWPYSQNIHGYGQINRGGRPQAAHRYICRLAHGEPPFPKADSAHKCGNRLCVAAGHVRWATRTENMADTIAHGTTNRGERCGTAKLNAEQVLKIRASSETLLALAKAYGVSVSAVHHIKRGSTWAHLQSPPEDDTVVWDDDGVVVDG
jgi:hypothetical protein